MNTDTFDDIMSEEVCDKSKAILHKSALDYLNIHKGTLMESPNKTELPTQLFQNPIDDETQEVVHVIPENNSELYSPEKLTRSRMVLAATNWNHTLGSSKNNALDVSSWVEHIWDNHKDVIMSGVQIDADKHLEVKWFPIAYFISQWSSSDTEERELIKSKRYVGITVAGEYVSLAVSHEGFFQAPRSEMDPTEFFYDNIEGDSIVVLRETTNDHEYYWSGRNWSGFVSKAKGNNFSSAKYKIKEANDKRHKQKNLAKRRAANKSASKARRINRK